MKKLIIITAVLLAAGAGAFWAFGKKNNMPEYRTEPVGKGDIQASVTATGAVNPVTTVLVGTQVSGTIKQLFADFNSPVRKGQVIAQIDPAIFEAAVEQARANLGSAQASLEKAEAAFTDAKRSLERNRELFGKNLVARSDLDSAETNFDTAKAQVGAAKAQITQTKAALSSAETNLRYTRIVAPVDGVVISRNVDVGQTVAASFQTPTLFTIAQDLTKMQIDTNVAESDIGSVQVGQQVEFTVDAYPETTFKGTVWQMRRAPITVQNVVTYNVVIKVGNPELKLMPGMTANVSIILETRVGVLRISNTALRFRPANKGAAKDQSKGPAVWVLDQGKPRRVPVKTGISDGTFTELLSGELREGQDVIVEAVVKAKQPSPAGPRMF